MMYEKETSMRSCFRRLKSIFTTSDMTASRIMVAASSLLFAGLLIDHTETDFKIWFWIMVSLIHAGTTIWSIVCDRINKITFVGEAMLGFILWNYIGLTVVTSTKVGLEFNPIDAPFAPTFVVGMATWWILTRYPTIRKHRINRY